MGFENGGLSVTRSIAAGGDANTQADDERIFRTPVRSAKYTLLSGGSTFLASVISRGSLEALAVEPFCRGKNPVTDLSFFAGGGNIPSS